MIDWHDTQNQEYIILCKKRLEEKKLIWVEQFASIIKNIFVNKNISINDIGCNVGHFYRAVKDDLKNIDYIGIDISDTYLEIAKNYFGDNLFLKADISKNVPRMADVSIISATLEHIEDHEQAIKNIMESSKKIIILRTFIGEEYLSENCFKDDAKSSYIIKQFTNKQLETTFKENGWEIEYLEDFATNNKEKYVCKNILRTQKIIIARNIGKK